jgi:hypothetical protein
LASGILAIGNVTPALAVSWVGDMILTARSAACPHYVEAGNYSLVRFTPGGVGGNGSDSSITLFNRGIAFSFRLEEGSFNGSNQTVEAFAVFETHHPVGNPVQVRFASVSPATITPTTQNLRITGQIRGHLSADCVVNFRFALTRELQ